MCESVSSAVSLTINLLSRAPVDEALRELQAARARLDAAQIRLVQQVQDDGSWSLTHQSSAAWLREVLNVDHPVAASWTGLARSTRRLPGMLSALADGNVTLKHVQVVAQGLKTADDELVAAVEPYLVEGAEIATPNEVAEVLQHVRTQTDPEHRETKERSEFDRRTLSLSRSADGTVHISGRLDAISGEMVTQAIAAFTAPKRDADGNKDERSTGQRTADALTQMSSNAIGAQPETTRNGTSQLLLLVSAGHGSGHEDEPHEPDHGEGCSCDPVRGVTANGTPLSPMAIGLLSCDARIALALVDNAADALLPRRLRRHSAEPLFLGRSQRVVSPGLRRALVLRDQGCVHPGCTAPASWCEAHHLQPWELGGTTDLPNLALVCTYHHHWLHAHEKNLERGPAGGWQVIDDPWAKARVHAHSHDPPLVA